MGYKLLNSGKQTLFLQKVSRLAGKNPFMPDGLFFAKKFSCSDGLIFVASKIVPRLDLQSKCTKRRQ